MRITLHCLSIVAFIYSSAATAQQSSIPVFVTELANQSLSDRIEALGTLQSIENIQITSSVTERIVEVNFTDGQWVSKGDLLIKMDTREEHALLEEELSILDQAKRQLKRLEPLYKRGATSESALDDAQSNVKTAAARIDAIQSQINERNIRAPFHGRLGLRNISVGEIAQPGSDLVTIDDDRLMRLDFTIPSIYLSALNVGSSIKATTKAYPNETFDGKVTSIDSRIDPVTRALMVRVTVDNHEYKLRPGMMMRVKMATNIRNAILVPEEAIITNKENHFVFQIDNTSKQPKVNMQKVKIGLRIKGKVEIIEGLTSGDRIVTHGTVRLRDGANVDIKANDSAQESLTNLLKQTLETAG